jgi:hypothetical protein
MSNQGKNKLKSKGRQISLEAFALSNNESLFI